MAFSSVSRQEKGIQLLQRSLERGRLAHAYLLSGDNLDQLEDIARNLAKTVNCLSPVKSNGRAVDCCDQCLACRKVDHGNHADVFWVRPESKSRQIRISQLVRREDSPPRVLLDAVHMKPTESEFKVGVVVGADRMNEQAANAFLKTLEEPPARSILILLTIEPQRLLETILSRCLRLTFGGERFARLTPEQEEWLSRFVTMAVAEQKSLISRYLLLDVLLKQLSSLRQQIEESVTARSPLERHTDAEPGLRDQWEDELKAAIEAEYRRQRSDVLGLLQTWLRDVWIHRLELSVGQGGEAPLQALPQIAGTATVAARITESDALQNLSTLELLQRWLGTNVQEALALEVALLKLKL